MILKNGLVTCKCDLRDDGSEILNSTQRNNEIVWPSKEEYPNAQYVTSWKNTCNTTSMCQALEYAGWKLPQGKYKQPEDNLTYFILTDKRIRDAYQKGQPVMYTSWMKSLAGQCSKQELANVFPPNELHSYLSMGTNLWLGSTATQFSTNTSFVKALWRYFALDNLPIVISTNFGGFGHIVTVTGVIWTESDYNKGIEQFKADKTKWPEVVPQSIVVDDPWGNLDLRKNVYPAGGGGSGNNKVIPWDFVVEHVKPLGSRSCKWAHTFKHGMATI